MLRFSEHLIMDGFGYAYGIAVADLDGDGDLDVLPDELGGCVEQVGPSLDRLSQGLT